jgi:hypothetical protein
MAFRDGAAPYRRVELDVSIGRWVEVPGARASERPWPREVPGRPARRLIATGGRQVATGGRQIVHDLMIIAAALALIGMGTRLAVRFEGPAAGYDRPTVNHGR